MNVNIFSVDMILLTGGGGGVLFLSTYYTRTREGKGLILILIYFRDEISC